MPTITPLGDQGFLIYFQDESTSLQFARSLRVRRPPWVTDIIPAYASVGILCDLAAASLSEIESSLRSALDDDALNLPIEPIRTHVIPCCYDLDLGLDLERVARHVGQSVAMVSSLHSAQEYTVHAIGFCPGFPYLGYLPSELAGVPRLESPRVRVDAGSVGLTGRQTGIYTEARPGGWNLIGRTPLTLVDPAGEYFPLRAGDRVRFRSIDRREYTALLGSRLESDQ